MSITSRYNVSRSFKKCYNITDRTIERIISTVKRHGGIHLRCSIELSNTDTLSSDDIESLLSDATLDVTKVSSISIRSDDHGQAGIRSFSIKFEESVSRGPIQLSVSGQKEAVNGLMLEMTQIIQGAQRLFWPLNYSGNFGVWIAYGAISLLVASPIALITPASSPLLKLAESFPAVYLLVTMVGLFAYASAFNGLRKYLFPSIQFQIGRSGYSAKIRDNVRILIFSTVILGVLLSLFSSFLYDYIKN